MLVAVLVLQVNSHYPKEEKKYYFTKLSHFVIKIVAELLSTTVGTESIADEWISQTLHVFLPSW